MAAAGPSNIELFDYADTRLGTVATCECPSVDSYEVGNLLSKQPAQPSSGDILLSPTQLVHSFLPNGAANTHGFMAESFVKPPVDIIFQLPYTISLAAIVVNPQIRQSAAKSIGVYVLRGRPEDSWQKWASIGRLSWESEIDSGQPRGLCNSELNPQAICMAADRQGSGLTCASGQGVVWLPIEPPPNTLHAVGSIKLRISSMHKAHALGLSRIEIWAQPSQRLPAAKRAQVWTEIRQALQPPTTAIISPHSSSSHATDVLQGPDCPSEFIDIITQNIMQDPVVLPSSIRCDRSTIARHLSMRSTDPFTGLPLEYDQAKPDLALQLRIREWISSQKGRHAASINKDEPKQY